MQAYYNSELLNEAELSFLHEDLLCKATIPPLDEEDLPFPNKTNLRFQLFFGGIRYEDYRRALTIREDLKKYYCLSIRSLTRYWKSQEGELPDNFDSKSRFLKETREWLEQKYKEGLISQRTYAFITDSDDPKRPFYRCWLRGFYMCWDDGFKTPRCEQFLKYYVRELEKKLNDPNLYTSRGKNFNG